MNIFGEEVEDWMNVSKVTIKEKDLLQEVADYMSRMIVKYSNRVSLEGLPEANTEMRRREIKEQYRIYVNQSRKMREKLKIVNYIVDYI